MNTREFVNYYRRLRKERNNEELTFQEAREEVEVFFDLIGDVVAMDEEIKFKNKGNFVLQKRKKRKIGSINTKEIKEIEPRDTVKFIQSKALEKEENKN
ncbi:MAG: HU family DNA-binding protein [Fusobacterium sp.]|uniref:HU family DNA-binding protein n=1 Tax=Fusobacterium sp. TaxID=68766 RepID=UPI00294213A0|nr:HU family DNA-binding protein [Fusobacterium sp.]MDY3059390.1 HU family DNA-binding protein [Fusobacterium sp.]